MLRVNNTTTRQTATSTSSWSISSVQAILHVYPESAYHFKLVITLSRLFTRRRNWISLPAPHWPFLDLYIASLGAIYRWAASRIPVCRESKQLTDKILIFLKDCCFSLPLYNLGIYAVLAEHLVIGLTAGVLVSSASTASETVS